VRFFACCAIYDASHINSDNFVFYGVCLPQLGSVLAAVIGLSNNDVISLRSLRCVRCVGWKPRLTSGRRNSVITKAPIGTAPWRIIIYLFIVKVVLSLMIFCMHMHLDNHYNPTGFPLFFCARDAAATRGQYLALSKA